MRKNNWLLVASMWALSTWTLSACGGAGAPLATGAQAPRSDYATMTAPPATASFRNEGASPSSAPPATLPSGDVRATEARERPGLGTEWGETRVSRVHDVTFVRADEDRPFAIASMHYNDLQGVQSLAAFHDGHASHLREVPSAGGAISFSIRDANGSPLEATRSADRVYVIGQQGERYSISLTNHTNHRFEAVATVDGLDVINGQPGTLASRGYVLQPFSTLEIDGFRQSHQAVAAFRFARVADSYAAQTSGDRNVGVIGVAFFAERGDSFDPSYDPNELERRDSANPFPAADPRFARPPHGF